MAIRTTPRAIFERLDKIAPDIDFNVEWEEDPSFEWDGEGPDPREEGYVPHDVRVSAMVVIEGKEIVGDAYLGGTYDKPDEQDPDIHGYLPQMLSEAVVNLIGRKFVFGPREWSPRGESKIKEQAQAAAEYLLEVMRVRHEKAMMMRRR